MPVPRDVLLGCLWQKVKRLNDSQLKQFTWYLQREMENAELWPQVDEDLALHPEDSWDEWIYHMAMVKEAADLMRTRGLVRAARVCDELVSGQTIFDKPPARQEAEEKRLSETSRRYVSDLCWEEKESVEFFASAVIDQDAAFAQAQKRRRKAEETSHSEGASE